MTLTDIQKYNTILRDCFTEHDTRHLRKGSSRCEVLSESRVWNCFERALKDVMIIAMRGENEFLMERRKQLEENKNIPDKLE